MHVDPANGQGMLMTDLDAIEQAIVCRLRTLRQKSGFGKLTIIVEAGGVSHVKVEESMIPSELIKRTLTVL